MAIDFYWSVKEGKYGKGSHFEKKRFYKFAYSYRLPLAIISVCLVSESHKSLLKCQFIEVINPKGLICWPTKLSNC